MGFFREASVYLGLVDDDRTVDDEGSERFDSRRGASSAADAMPGAPVTTRHPPVMHGSTAVAYDNPYEEDLDDQEYEPEHAPVTPLRRTPVAQVVNDVEVTAVNRITTIHPRTYNEARNIGEAFREGTPVIMNLTDLDDSDAKRLVDFAAGLVFGLQGTIERVTNRVFLLSPSFVEVTSEDGETPSNPRGLFNQS